MLTSLRVRDLAVLEDVEVSFGEGLTVLTGETGAGKSLVVDALSLLSGERGDPRWSGPGPRSSSWRAPSTRTTPASARRSSEAGLVDPGAKTAEVAIRREIGSQGKGRLFLNGSPAVLKTLGELAPRLLVLYGQAEARELLDPAAPRELVDRFAGLAAAGARTAELFRVWRGAGGRSGDG